MINYKENCLETTTSGIFIFLNAHLFEMVIKAKVKCKIEMIYKAI